MMLHVFAIFLILLEHVNSMTSSETVKNNKKTFNKLLERYDPKIPPVINDSIPIEVAVGIFIVDFVPMKTRDLHYSMHIFFRQSWDDSRLSFADDVNSTIEELTFHSEMAARIWKPTLYFPRMKSKSASNLLLPNEILVIKRDGGVYYSHRLNIIMFCDMDLSDFPFDYQLCNFSIQSYAFRHNEMNLHWMKPKAVELSGNNDMTEYTFQGLTTSSSVAEYVYGSYDTLHIELRFSRNINYYLLQVYLPCALIVILSWVGFWIDYRSTPARVALGITTVLTMITFMNSVRQSHTPSVNQSKLVNWYILGAFLYVFMAFIEYVSIGIVERHWNEKIKQSKHNDVNEKKPEKRTMMELKKQRLKSSKSTQKFIWDNHKFNDNTESGHPSSINTELPYSRDTGLWNDPINKEHRNENNENPGLSYRGNEKQQSINPTGFIFEGLQKVFQSKRHGFLHKLKDTPRNVDEKLFQKQLQRKREGIHILDRIARYMFPISFLVFNIIYFIYAMEQKKAK